MNVLDVPAGPLRFDAEIGAGGMGRVFRATLLTRAFGIEPGTAVAAKLPEPGILGHEGGLQRFLREAEAGRRIVHENVVRTYGIVSCRGAAGTVPVIVLEYVQGPTLREVVEAAERPTEGLCRLVAGGIASGLGAMHAAGIVHRDVKPENVLLTPDGVAKLMDLGVARVEDATSVLTHTGAFLGSLRYGAPEQFASGARSVDGRADLHALGVVLYEMATGAHPFGDEKADFRTVIQRILEERPPPLRSARPDLSAQLEEVVATLLEKDPAARYATAEEVVGALRASVAAESADVRGPSASGTGVLPGFVPPFVGREGELDRIRGLYGRARVGGGSTLLLTGPDGSGKSRLVREVVEGLRCEGEKVEFLFGAWQGAPGEDSATPFADALARQFGDHSLYSTVMRHLSVPSACAKRFAERVRDRHRPSRSALSDAEIAACTIGVLKSLSAHHPTVVFADDIHLAPPGGRAVFAELARAVRAQRILLVGATRDGEDEGWLRDVDHAGVLTRVPLTPHAAVRTSSILGISPSRDSAPRLRPGTYGRGGGTRGGEPCAAAGRDVHG